MRILAVRSSTIRSAPNVITANNRPIRVAAAAEMRR